MNKYIKFPSKNEFPESSKMYMRLVKKDGTLIKQFEDSLKRTKALFCNLSNKELNFRYDENKWSIKEVLVHIIDDERIFGYRALTFARNDKTNLPGFDQNDYMNNANTSERTIENIFAEYEAIRRSTITMFNGFSDEALLRKGKADNIEVSVRALGYHILGHELHHIKILEDIYLKMICD